MDTKKITTLYISKASFVIQKGLSFQNNPESSQQLLFSNILNAHTSFITEVCLTYTVYIHNWQLYLENRITALKILIITLLCLRFLPCTPNRFPQI